MWFASGATQPVSRGTVFLRSQCSRTAGTQFNRAVTLDLAEWVKLTWLLMAKSVQTPLTEIVYPLAMVSYETAHEAPGHSTSATTVGIQF